MRPLGSVWLWAVLLRWCCDAAPSRIDAADLRAPLRIAGAHRIDVADLRAPPVASGRAAAAEPRTVEAPLAAVDALQALGATGNDTCVDALVDYATNIGDARNQLALLASANYVVIAELIMTASQDSSALGPLYEALVKRHLDDYGDATACNALDGFRYSVATKGGLPLLGLCLPKVCEAHNLQHLLRQLPALLPPSEASSVVTALLPDTVLSGSWTIDLDGVGYALILLTIALACLCLAATACEPSCRRGLREALSAKEKAAPEDYAPLGRLPSEEEAYRGPEWLRCFSLVRTWGQWLAKRGGALGCLDGIRVFSMLLVVYGHTVLWGLTYYTNSYEDAYPPDGLVAKPRGQLVPSAEFSVDSFFWLSGFLAAYVMGKIAADAKLIWVPCAFVQRYLRLTPVYMYVLFLWWKVFRVAGGGAIWTSQRYSYSLCAKWWWTNLLYINNVYPFHKPAQCYGVSWYLPNDMQFFLLLPAFVLLRSRVSPRAAYAAFVAVGLASIAYALWAAYAYDLSFATFDGTSYQVDYYFRPWTRIPPYLIGAATALAYRDRNGSVSPRTCSMMLVVGLVVAGLTFFGSYSFNKEIPSEPPAWLNHIYLALSKPAWAVSLSLIAWPCFLGRGSLVGSVLQLRVFEPFAKLTYVMYLIHPAVLDIFFKSTNSQRILFSEQWFYTVFLGVVCIVSGLSLLVHLVVEQPVGNLCQLLLRPPAKAAPPTPPSPGLEVSGEVLSV